MTCSGNYNNIGIVTNSNNEITRILGYNKSDIIDNNVSRLMPKIIADMHEGFMVYYFLYIFYIFKMNFMFIFS